MEAENDFTKPNLYKTPDSVLVETQQEVEVSREFYVVGPAKFMTLFISSMGFYTAYWFYKNWKLHKIHSNKPMIPVMRGIFPIFFAHSLFNTVSKKLKEKGLRFIWDPGSLATSFVVLSIISNVGDRMSMKEIGSPYSDLVSILLIPALAFILFKAQAAINLLSGDPQGNSNSRLTGPNFVWIVVGVILWLLIGLDLYDILVGLPPDFY